MFIIFISLLFISCTGNEADQKTTSDRSPDILKENRDPDRIDEEEKLVDAASLKIYDMNLFNYDTGNSTKEFVSIDVDSRANYINFEICSLDEKDCQSITSAVGKVKFDPIYGSDMIIKAQACVFPDNSIDSVECGDKEQKLHRSSFYNPQKASLQFELLQMKSQLRKIIAEDYVNALKIFDEQSAYCTEINEKAQELLLKKRNVIKNYIRQPLEYFKFSADQLYDTFTGEKPNTPDVNVIDGFADDIKESGKQVCKDVLNLEQIKEGLCPGIGQFLQTMSPINSIGGLSESMHNVYAIATGNADALLPIPCIADSNLVSTTSLIDNQINAVEKNIFRIERELDAIDN